MPRGYKLIILFSFLISGLITLILYFVLDATTRPVQAAYYLMLCLLFAVLFGLLVFFGFKSYTQRQISYLNKLYPQLDLENDMNMEKITKKIQSISQLQTQQIDLLKEKENYRREFFGNVSHELKTPLFSIQGFLLTLIEGGKDEEELLNRYLNRINKSVERLIYVVNDLDMIAALESDTKLEVKAFNIVALIRETIDLLEMKAAKHKIDLIFIHDDNNPIKVLGDIKRIEQVLINLLENAIKHSGDSDVVRLTLNLEGNKCRIEIIDYGPGIPIEEQNRIFERFYRLDKSRSRETGGSGLGLAIVKHILETHQSKIYLKSEEGEGCTFGFLLDLAKN